MSIKNDTTSKARLLFFIVAAVLTVASTLFSNRLAKDLATEEKKKIELWAEAVRLFVAENDETVTMDYTLILSVIEGNTNIPVILMDEQNNVLEHNNLDIDTGDSIAFSKRVQKIINKQQLIEIRITDEITQYVYYDDSGLLRKLTYFPFIQLSVMFIFLLVTVYALNTSKRAEQDKVWVGLSKETAHQLGTPISSLMAWVDLLKLKDVDPDLLKEIAKDTERLSTIAERFSKIGSKSSLAAEQLGPALTNAVHYIQNRSSKRIRFQTDIQESMPTVRLNIPLFEWVIENLCKNAIDAMDADGLISISAQLEGKHAIIDVRDTGKGIPKKQFKTVFKPGYTTKARGWGLGLSLVKRIIESNHNGKIYVKNSELGKGTTFRILLPVDQSK
ncbi:MAG: sensor histidine kinase [Bacteroidales bacterium]